MPAAPGLFPDPADTFSDNLERQLFREHQFKFVCAVKEPRRDPSPASSAVLHGAGCQLRVRTVKNAVGDGNSFSRAVDRQADAAGRLKQVSVPPSCAVAADHHAAAQFSCLGRSACGEMNPRIDLDPCHFAGANLDLSVPVRGRREKPDLSLLIGSGEPVAGDGVVPRGQRQPLVLITRFPFEAGDSFFRSPEEQFSVCDGAGDIARFPPGLARVFRGGRGDPDGSMQLLRTEEFDKGPPGPGGSPRSGGPLDLVKPGPVK